MYRIKSMRIPIISRNIFTPQWHREWWCRRYFWLWEWLGWNEEDQFSEGEFE